MTTAVDVAETITYDEFLANISSPDPRPLLIGPALISPWHCLRTWRDESGSPNLSTLRRYGDQLVQVANCSKRQFNEFERTERTLSEVLDLWESGDGQSLYVKDWHLMLEIEKEGRQMEEVYETPDIFKDDWLTPASLHPTNPDHSPSDYRFTYLGPRGTYTPLHRDVFRSYSWSTNVAGRKRWLMIRPEDVELFRKGGEMVFDLREMQGSSKWDRVLVIEQLPGQTIFVPSGWWHQVENLDFCISINQNFITSFTIPLVYANLLESLQRCEESISDVREMIQQRLGSVKAGRTTQVDEDVLEWEVEWVEQVQSLLEMDAGWNFRGFWDMMLYNLRSPAAPVSLRPSDASIKNTVRGIVADYRIRREWVILQNVQSIVLQVEEMLDIDLLLHVPLR